MRRSATERNRWPFILKVMLFVKERNGVSTDTWVHRSIRFESCYVSGTCVFIKVEWVRVKERVQCWQHGDGWRTRPELRDLYHNESQCGCVDSCIFACIQFIEYSFSHWFFLNCQVVDFTVSTIDGVRWALHYPRGMNLQRHHRCLYDPCIERDASPTDPTICQLHLKSCSIVQKKISSVWNSLR